MCTLLRKPDAVRADVDITYVGFDIPNEFVVGYGLDYAERYRDLPTSAPWSRRSIRPDPAPGGESAEFPHTTVTAKPTVCLPGCNGTSWAIALAGAGAGIGVGVGGRDPAGASEIETTLPSVRPDSSAYCSARFLASSNARARASSNSAESSRIE